MFGEDGLDIVVFNSVKAPCEKPGELLKLPNEYWEKLNKAPNIQKSEVTYFYLSSI